MATMNRNLNLEEVNSDAFMGISYLNYQTMPQKIVFIGSIVAGVAINLTMNFIFEVSSSISVFLSIIPLIAGAAFGCNYNQDLSLVQYLSLVLFKPKKSYGSRSTEDLAYIRQTSDDIRREEEKQQTMSPEEHRKFLVKVAIGAAVSVIIFIVLLVVLMVIQPDTEIHHTVSSVYWRMG